MKILILGGDGYLGWPTALHFSDKGYEVHVVDNFNKRKWELEQGIEPLIQVHTLHNRIFRWKEISGKSINLHVGDLCNHRFVYKLLRETKPDTIIHYAEQPSAPYSMQSRTAAVETQVNNVVGNMNVLFGMKANCPNAHLIKLGTMGEYGTPNIDIEEGYLEVEHKGRKDTVLYPKKPGSFYHLSKVHDSNNIYFTCRMWDLIATDLNQGVVYGLDTDQTILDPILNTSFHYDDIFGTVSNRFLVQACCGYPLTVYGKGGQTRGFLNIKDTIQCIDLATHNPANPGEFRVFNQFTEQFSVLQLAELVVGAGQRAGLDVKIKNLSNPRIELEEHYYNAIHSKFSDLGLVPNFLTDNVLDNLLQMVMAHSKNANQNFFTPRVPWSS